MKSEEYFQTALIIYQRPNQAVSGHYSSGLTQTCWLLQENYVGTTSGVKLIFTLLRIYHNPHYEPPMENNTLSSPPRRNATISSPLLHPLPSRSKQPSHAKRCGRRHSDDYRNRRRTKKNWKTFTCRMSGTIARNTWKREKQKRNAK